MTNRAPHFSPAGRSGFPAELRTWVHSQQIPQPVVQKPFSQNDWPNPPPARRVAPGWWQSGQFIQELAPFVTDCPPPLRRAPNLAALSWSRSAQIQPPAQTNPFAQYDWPNPLPRSANLELRTWLDGLPQSALSITLPQRQSDWPNPAPKAPNLELRTWTEGLPQSALSLALPPTQKDWPNPTLRQPLYELRTWMAWAQLQPAVPKPFAQTEWPNPVLSRANLELRDWKQALPPGEIRRTGPPVQLDWPNPLLPRQPVELWAFHFPSPLDIPTVAPITSTLAARIERLARVTRVNRVLKDEDES